MATRQRQNQPTTPGRPPGTTPEARENQLISLAVDLVERQLREGTASSQVITHYLKLGSSRERLEQGKLEAENILLQARAENLASQKKVEEMYGKALEAMQSYSGRPSSTDVDYDEFDD